MTQNNRSRRRGPTKAAATPPPAGGDRYQKFLPEWMRGNGTPVRPVRPVRPARPRKPRQDRGGGYTPGKFALGDRGLL